MTPASGAAPGPSGGDLPGLPGLPAPLTWRQQADILWIDAPLGVARAAFSARGGGLSTGPYRSLNLGILTGDEPDLVLRNRTALVEAAGREPGGVAMGWQVHGAGIVRHREPPRRAAFAHPGAGLPEADAHVTGNPDVTPLVLVADCLPVAVAAPGAVAMVHCGWRGVAAGIVQGAVEAVAETAGSGPEELAAALGPGIGPCCYAVGQEVEERFRERGHGERVAGGGRLDLPLAVRGELARAGVAAERILDCALCTSCHPGLFFSHRRDRGVTGRQAGLAWLEDGAAGGGGAA